MNCPADHIEALRQRRGFATTAETLDYLKTQFRHGDMSPELKAKVIMSEKKRRKGKCQQ